MDNGLESNDREKTGGDGSAGDGNEDDHAEKQPQSVDFDAENLQLSTHEGFLVFCSG